MKTRTFAWTIQDTDIFASCQIVQVEKSGFQFFGPFSDSDLNKFRKLTYRRISQ